jgi:hypothetical protein
MTIKDLKDFLAELPDDMPVEGGCEVWPGGVDALGYWHDCDYLMLIGGWDD